MKRKKRINTTIIMGVMYFLNQKASFKFFVLFLNFPLISLIRPESSEILLRLSSLPRSISNDSVIILLTSISSWFSLSIFYCAFISLNSYFFRFITFSTHNDQNKVSLLMHINVNYLPNFIKLYCLSIVLILLP